MEKNDWRIGGTLIRPSNAKAEEYAPWTLDLHKGCIYGCMYCRHRCGTQDRKLREAPMLVDSIRRLSASYYTEYKINHSLDDWFPTNYHFDMWAAQDILDDDIFTIGQDVLRHYGIFVSSRSDPFADNFFRMNFRLVLNLLDNYIPVTVLTKSIGWMNTSMWKDAIYVIGSDRRYSPLKQLTVGFSITGCDEEEPNTPPNQQRISALRSLRGQGLRTFVSFNPLTDFCHAKRVIEGVMGYTDEIRIGCLSPQTRYSYQPIDFVNTLDYIHQFWKGGTNIFIEKSVARQAFLMPEGVRSHCLKVLKEMMGERYRIVDFE